MENTNFKTTFTEEGYAGLMSLIFEDENFTHEELYPIVLNGIEIAKEKYQKNNRTETNFFIYATYFVKKEVLAYKNLK